MIMIVGLGNPGQKYQNTRHNLGFMVVDKLAKELLPLGKTKWKFDQKANALVLEASPQLILVKPQTFMNASGFAVKSLTTSYQLPITNLLVVYDDVDISFGKLKIRFGGGAAGHHGVESIIRELGTDKFWRLRIGIGRPIREVYDKNRGAKDIEEYVLGKFKEKEWGKLKNTIKKAVEAIKVVLNEGPEKAINTRQG